MIDVVIELMIGNDDQTITDDVIGDHAIPQG